MSSYCTGGILVCSTYRFLLCLYYRARLLIYDVFCGGDPIDYQEELSWTGLPFAIQKIRGENYWTIVIAIASKIKLFMREPILLLPLIYLYQILLNSRNYLNLAQHRILNQCSGLLQYNQIINFIMLSNAQTHTLKKILSKQKGTLQQLQQEYINAFKQTISLFNVASYLSQMLQSQKLQLEERMISLYLLLISFHQGSGQNHPFILNLLFISEMSQENWERTMIYDIIIRKNKNKYSSRLIQDLQSLADKEKQLSDEQKQIKKLRHMTEQKFKHFQCNLPVNYGNDSVPDFLRLVPEYIPVSTSQLNWLSPGIISDVQWDNSAQIQKKLQKSRKIYENSLKRTLEQQERTQLLNSIQSDPYSALHIGFSVNDLSLLITHNPYIAASLIIKLSKYPVFQQFLQQFLSLPTSVPLLDVTARIIKQIRVPQLYVEIFCSHHLNKMTKTRDSNNEHCKILAYTMSAFLHCMFENEIISPFKISVQLTNFMNQFSNIMDFGHIRVLLEQQKDNSR